MAGLLARYRKIAAFADEPTPLRRLAAAGAAALLAFALTQLVLGVLWGAGASAVLFSSVALAVAAAVAAVTVKPAMAVVYGILAAFWLLLEAVALLLGSIVAGLG